MTSPIAGAASVRVAASPLEVYEFLTDLERLPTLSPENHRCERDSGEGPLAVGDRFTGHNRVGTYEWSAQCEVTVAEPGVEFAYDVPPGFSHATRWRYTMAADGDETVVTEYFDAPLLARPDIYPGQIDGRRDGLEAACEQTMANLKAAFEG